jgi:hypothetical protein
LTVQKNYSKKVCSFKNATYIPTWVYRGDGTMKMHILFPSEWALDSSKLPKFLNISHQQKMLEAFNDTRLILTKYNPELKLNSVK